MCIVGHVLTLAQPRLEDKNRWELHTENPVCQSRVFPGTERGITEDEQDLKC